MLRVAYSVLLASVLVLGTWSLSVGVGSVLQRAAGVANPVDAGRSSASGNEDDPAATELLLWATRLDPGNPVYRQRLAQHFERLAMRRPRSVSANRILLTDALQLYTEAAVERPTWPFSFTPVLRTRLKLGQHGPFFENLYRHSYLLGRAELPALRDLVNLGLAAWPLLDERARDTVSGVLKDALLRDAAYTIRRAVRLDRTAVIEALLSSSDEQARALFVEIRSEKGRAR